MDIKNVKKRLKYLSKSYFIFNSFNLNGFKKPTMNNAARKTLIAIFHNPVSHTIEWRDIEKLMHTVGAKEVDGSGSRVRFVLNQIVLLIHRPHPEKEMKPYQIRDTRAFLEGVRVTP